jgi:hypothetical protein
MSKEFFISGNVPSSKNSKNAVAGKGVFHSETVMKYLRGKGIQGFSVREKTVKGYANRRRPNTFILEVSGLQAEVDAAPIKPVLIGFHFVRDSRRGYDFHNAVQIIFDLLVAHNIIEDDDTKLVYGIPYQRNGKFESLDPKNAGVYLKVITDLIIP